MKKSIVIYALLFIMAALPVLLQAQERGQRPPEYNRYRQAMRIQDLNERITELQKILTEFPETQYKLSIEAAVVHANIGLSGSLDKVLELQAGLLEGQSGISAVGMYYSLAREILRHEKLDRFSQNQVTKAVGKYAQTGLAILKDPEFAKGLLERQRSSADFYRANYYLLLSHAYLNQKSMGKSEEALKAYLDNGGAPNKSYYYFLGQTHELADQTQEAFEGYFEAAVENFQDSVDKSRQLYQKLHGSLQGFDAKLEAKWREMPFHPEVFKPEPAWQGKVVVAELFTGAQCPPCVAADLGFDGLIDAYKPQHLAVLVYHLHIPGPDPLTNHASSARAAYYRANSTPTTLFDGENKHGGGGDRSRGELKFGQYTQAIKEQMYAAPPVKLEVNAALQLDFVQITFTADKVLEGCDYHLALVQKEARYGGSNGIVFHKMVVREFITVQPQVGKASIDLTESEKKAAASLVEYENARSYSFKEKLTAINRSQLSVVFMAQDRESKKIFNAAVCEVK
jgi:hypothetical protein